MSTSPQIQTEFDALASTLTAQRPSAQQRWGLVTYRDHGDAYGLAEAMSRDWSAGATARLLSWAGDASHHEDRTNALVDAVRQAAARGG